MGVEPYLVANSLVGVVAQRLVRTICPKCKEEVPAKASDKIAVGEDIKKFQLVKLSILQYTGYKGRIAVHEIILIDGTVRRMISRKAEIDEIKEYLNLEQGLETLQDQAVQLVKDGITTVAELNKIKVYSD